VKSTPVDIAVPPVFPKNPNLLLFTIAGALAGALMSIVYVTANEAMRGLRASEENLREIKMHASGAVFAKQLSCAAKPIHDRALETLRKVIGHLYRTPTESHPTHNAIAIIGVDHPHFAKDLAAIAAVKGLNVLVVPLTFKNESQPDDNGLLQYLEGKNESPKISRHGNYDSIAPGGASRFGPELFSSKRFSNLLKTFCQKYDWVLCWSEAKITGAEGQSLAKIYDNLCICLEDETLEDLRIIRNLEQQDHNKRVTCVFYHDDS
jgi:hypothetical protein